MWETLRVHPLLDEARMHAGTLTASAGAPLAERRMGAGRAQEGRLRCFVKHHASYAIPWVGSATLVPGALFSLPAPRATAQPQGRSDLFFAFR